MMRRWTKALREDERGVTAMEFALVAPVFLAFIFGVFHLSLVGFTIANLNYAVEKAARCNALSTECPDSATYYLGPSPVPVFTIDRTAACGTSANASVNYQLNVLIYQAPIPLSASACFPARPGAPLSS